MDETHPEDPLLTEDPRWLRGHSYGAMPPARSSQLNPKGPKRPIGVRGKTPAAIFKGGMGEAFWKHPKTRSEKNENKIKPM